MKKFILTFCCSLLLIVSAKSQTGSSAEIIKSKGIGIQALFSEKVDSVYMPLIDKCIEIAMLKFNAEKHQYKVHPMILEDSARLILNFSRAKFRTKEDKTTGCVVSLLGLVALPYIVYMVSKGTFILAAWYYPVDIIDLKIKVNPAVCINYKSAWTFNLNFDSYFQSEIKRKKRAEKVLTNRLLKILKRIDRQVMKCSA
ncbi:MAG: hypothetical protein V2A54_03200 [Bacteroidota bacterium]